MTNPAARSAAAFTIASRTAAADALTATELTSFAKQIRPPLVDKLLSRHPRRISPGAHISLTAHAVIAIFELASVNVTVHDIDAVAATVYEIVKAMPPDQLPELVVLILPVVYRKPTVVMKSLLLPLLQANGIALAVCQRGKRGRILTHGNLPTITVPATRPLPQPPPTQRDDSHSINIRPFFRELVGHFGWQSAQTGPHLTALITIDELIPRVEMYPELRKFVRSRVSGQAFKVLPYGLPGSDMAELCTAVFGADAVQEINDGSKQERSVAVLFVDVLTAAQPLNTILERLRRAFTSVVIVGLASFADVPSYDVPVHTFVHLPYRSYATAAQCELCQLGSTVTLGHTVSDLEHAVADFDEPTFWYLVGLRSEHYATGHWPSTSTGYHYTFRITGTDLFGTHAAGFARRLFNRMQAVGVRRDWITKIVCVTSPESDSIAQAFARLLRYPYSDTLVSVPRDALARLAGVNMWEDVRSPELGAIVGRLEKEKVIIVDQAANHFGTLASLRRLCQRANATMLALGVVINRLPPDFNLPELERDTHYVNLYTWYAPVWKSNDCICLRGAQGSYDSRLATTIEATR